MWSKLEMPSKWIMSCNWQIFSTFEHVCAFVALLLVLLLMLTAANDPKPSRTSACVGCMPADTHENHSVCSNMASEPRAADILQTRPVKEKSLLMLVVRQALGALVHWQANLLPSFLGGFFFYQIKTTWFGKRLKSVQSVQDNESGNTLESILNNLLLINLDIIFLSYYELNRKSTKLLRPVRLITIELEGGEDLNKKIIITWNNLHYYLLFTHSCVLVCVSNS